MLRLPEKQEKVWELSWKGISQKAIAEILGISKQAVSMYLKQAKAKLTEILLDIANAADLSVLKIDAQRGILIGKSKQLNERVFVFYIPKKGPIVIFEQVIKQKRIPEDSIIWSVIDFYGELFRENNPRKILEKAFQFAEKL